MDYLLLKWIHILSSTILFGTGVGSAFYMFMANCRKEISGIVFATRHVVLADWLFTTPAVIVQPLSGIYLAYLGNYALTEPWLFTSILLYLAAGACWLPVVWLQIQMRNLAWKALQTNTPLPPRYWQYNRYWILLGTLAFPAIIVVFWLMVTKG